MPEKRSPVTFLEFAEEIADSVHSVVPGATCKVAQTPTAPTVVSLGAAKVIVTREQPGWRVVFSRGPGVAAPSAMTGKGYSEETAGKIAAAIAGFLI